MRADAGVKARADGLVSIWADQSGNGNDFGQSDPNLQPRLVAAAVNGLPALRFDGVDNALTLATAPLPLAGKSVFAVVKWDLQRPYSFAIGLDAGTDGYLRMSTETALLTGGRYPVLYQNGIPYLKESRPGDQRKLFHFVSSTLLRFNVYAVTDNPSITEKLKHLGKNELNNTPGNRFAGQIAEVLVYDRALAPAERQQIEEYLGRKYLAWPALTAIPVAANAQEAQGIKVRLAAEKPLPVAVSGTEGGILAHGTSRTPLAAGRYRLHCSVDAAVSPTVAYSVRFGSELRRLSLTPGGAGQIVTLDFTRESGAPLDPTLVRFSWERSAAGSPPTPDAATICSVYLEALSPVVVRAVSVDKILYEPDQRATATATVANYAGAALPAEVRFTEITGLDDRRLLGVSPVTVPGGGEITVTLPYIVGAREYGRDLLVEVVRDGKVLETNSETYSVADSLWKVALGSPTVGAISSSANYSEEAIVKQLQELRKGYCNWIEKDFWAPDDWGLMVTTPGATWFSGQARRHENTEKLQLQIKAAQDLGMKAITYGKCMAGGLPGWELARRRPQWFSVDAYGRTRGRPADVWDLDHWQEGDKYKYADYKYTWTYRWVDLRRMEPLDHGIGQLIASTKEFGWDGVRFDSGGFRAYYVDGRFDGVDAYNARNMRYTKKTVWQARPGFLFGYNTTDPVSSEKTGGACPLLPTDPCGHEFREMMAGGGLWMFEGLRDKPKFWGRVAYPKWTHTLKIW